MGDIVNQSGLTSEELGMPWERIIRGAALCENKRRSGKWDGIDSNSDEDTTQWPCNIVYTVLDAMVAFPPENKDVTFEALCNALVRRTVFVTGAVDMDGCPEADRGEVAFIGRSNVGKSSLVNMVRRGYTFACICSLSNCLFSLTVPFHSHNKKSKVDQSQSIGIHKQNPRKDTTIQLLCSQ